MARDIKVLLAEEIAKLVDAALACSDITLRVKILVMADEWLECLAGRDLEPEQHSRQH